MGERKTFGSEENEAVVLGADGSETPVPYGPKEALADTVWDLVAGSPRVNGSSAPTDPRRPLDRAFGAWRALDAQRSS